MTTHGNFPVTLGREIRHMDLVESTNDMVKAAAESGEPEGLVVIAKAQTKGRGRRGKVWLSEPGLGLYLSVLLRPGGLQAEAAWLAMVMGVAAADTIESLGVTGATIKWPNDVLVRGKKIAGVLVEPRLEKGRIEFAIVGVGLNVGHAKSDFPPELKKIATSLRIEGVSATCDDAAQAFIASLDRWYRAERNLVQDAWSRKGGTEKVPVVE